MKIEKLKYGCIKWKRKIVPLEHKITEDNFGKYFKTLIARDGYEVKTVRTSMLGISKESPVHVELHSPRGKQRVRGYRTFYRITCESVDDLEQVFKELGHKEG